MAFNNPSFPLPLFFLQQPSTSPRSMDLSTIRKNLDTGVIRTTREFQRDVMLMFTNALMYNTSSHDVHNMAKTMYRDAMCDIEVVWLGAVWCGMVRFVWFGAVWCGVVWCSVVC